MTSYRLRPPSPRADAPNPSYPRLLGLSLLVFASACGGSVSEPGAQGTGGTDQGTGGTAGLGTGGGGAGAPYDAQPPPPADAATEADVPPPDGDIAPPFDAATEADAPPLDGDIAPPFDAGQDGWTTQVDGGDTDGGLSGAAPAPYDADTCETSIPVP